MSHVDWSTLETQARDRIAAQVSDFKTGRVFVAATVELARTKAKGMPAAGVAFAGVDRFVAKTINRRIVQLAYPHFKVEVYAELAKADGLAFIPSLGLVKKVVDALTSGWSWDPGNGGPVDPITPTSIAPPEIDGGIAIVGITFEAPVCVS